MARVSADIRTEIVDSGIRLLESNGLQGFSVRKLAAEAGTSTMAVYTHFGGMTGVFEAIASEVFARFTQALTKVARTDDPVADFFVMGMAYREFALANPQRYQLMFGQSTPPSLAGYRTDVTVTGAVTSRGEWAASFDALRDVVRRMIDAGRIRDDGELVIAGRLWSMTHGAVMLEMADFFGHEGHAVTQILAPLATDALVGMGDDRENTMHSLEQAAQRMSTTAG
jgi:AcrR family transcriptional regulator